MGSLRKNSSHRSFASQCRHRRDASARRCRSIRDRPRQTLFEAHRCECSSHPREHDPRDDDGTGVLRRAHEASRTGPRRAGPPAFLNEVERPLERVIASITWPSITSSNASIQTNPAAGWVRPIALTRAAFESHLHADWWPMCRSGGRSAWGHRDCPSALRGLDPPDALPVRRLPERHTIRNQPATHLWSLETSRSILRSRSEGGYQAVNKTAAPNCFDPQGRRRKCSVG